MARPLPVFFLALLVVVTAPAWADPPALYEITDPTPRTHEATSAIPGLVGEVEIMVDTETIDQVPDALDLVLPDGRRARATRSYFAVERDYISWAGPVYGIEGTTGHMHVLDYGERLAGVIRMGDDRYRIVAAGDAHRLVRIVSRDKVCAHGDTTWTAAGTGLSVSPLVAPGGFDDATIEPAGATGSVPADAAPPAEKALTYIDVLALYPKIFSEGHPGLFDFIDLSVSKANEVFLNSNVDTRYRLVGKVRLTGQPQPPSSGVLAALDWMTPFAEAEDDEDALGPQTMLDARDAYAADMVALFVPHWYQSEEDNACGAANLPIAFGNTEPLAGTFGKRAYSVHRNACGLADYTFAHELGHNFGMRHAYDDPQDLDPSTALFSTGRGHVLSATPWRNIANGTLETNVEGNFTVGYHFTPSVDGYVVGLGGLFKKTKLIKLWDYASGAELLDPMSLPGGLPVVGTNTWKYEALLDAIPVEAGKKYTVATFIGVGMGGGSVYSNVVPFPRSSNGVTIHGTTVAQGMARPTDTRTHIMYGQVDIQFVPESALGATVLGCTQNDPNANPTVELCNRIPYFSDPNIAYNGYPTGTAVRKNARVARLQSASYANHRTPGVPVCRNDRLVAQQDAPLTILYGHVMGNDIAPVGTNIGMESFDPVTNKGGTNGQDGGVVSFVYTPPAGFHGRDWFSYTIEAGTGETDTCVVEIDVIPTPTSPECRDDFFTTRTNTSRQIFFNELIANDVDEDGDEVTLAAFDTTTAQGGSNAQAGSVVSLTYTPPVDFCGAEDWFFYTARAGGETTAPCRVTIDVICPNRPHK